MKEIYHLSKVQNKSAVCLCGKTYCGDYCPYCGLKNMYLQSGEKKNAKAVG